MTTRDQYTSIKPAVETGEWVNLRNAQNEIDGRYNRRTRQLIIFRRKSSVSYDLASLDTPCEKCDNPL